MGTTHKRDTMNPLLILFFPLAEIAGFILVGRAIGVLPTLALIVASSVVGLALLRDAGLTTILELQRGRDAPAKVLAAGGTRMLTGLLLLIPGFLSDLAAAALLVPGVRKWLAGRVGADGARRQGGAPSVIEGEFRRLDG